MSTCLEAFRSCLVDEGIPSLGMGLLSLPWAADRDLQKTFLFDSCKGTFLRTGVSFACSGSLEGKELAQQINGMVFAFEAQKIFTLIHETGHWVAAKLLTKSPPQIQLTSSGGETIYSTNTLSPLGEKVGKSLSKIVILMAGPFFESCAACFGWIGARALEEEHPRLSLYLKCSSLLSVLSTASYVWSSAEGGDFSKLSKEGFSRMASFVTYVATPVFLACAHTQGSLLQS